MPVKRNVARKVAGRKLTKKEMIENFLVEKSNPGVIYCMTTLNEGLVKIGKCLYKEFNNRMNSLERDGYKNIAGHKRKFAILVSEYDDKESMIHNVFSTQRIGNTELFAVNDEKVVSLLSALDGIEIYPTDISKDDIFLISNSENISKGLLDGVYYLNAKQSKDKKIYKAYMKVKDGTIKLTKGSEIIINPSGKNTKISPSYDLKRRDALSKIDNEGKITKDIEVNSPSEASVIIRGIAYNGWTDWETATHQKIDIFRK